MSKRSRKKASRGRLLSQGGDLVRLDLGTIRALADAAGRKPEQGRRTPRASINRWNRRTFFDLEFGDLTAILRRMEDGDTRDGVDLWLRMLKVDDHLHSVWESRNAPVFSAPHEVLPGKPGTHGAVRLADACREVLDSLEDLEATNSALLGAKGVGFAVGEIEWKRGSLLGVPAWIPARVIPIHSRRFRWSDEFQIGLWDDGLAVSRLRDAGWSVTELTGRGARIAALPAGKYIVHTPVGIHDYPTAAGLVHPVSRWWWVKQVATKYWLHGSEIAANPRIIGSISQLAHGSITLEEFFEDLETLAADGVMVCRHGTSVDVQDSKASLSADVWDKLFRRMDAAMSKAVLGSTLNVEIDSAGGNRAAAESQGEKTILPRQHQDQAQLWSTWRRDVFRWVRDYNPHMFAPDTPLPSARSILIEETGTVDEVAISTGAVTVDQVLQSRGLPTVGGALGKSFVRPDGAPAQVSESDTSSAAAAAATAPAAELAPGVEEDVQATAYNGAQAQAFDGILQAVVEGQKPRSLAIEQLITLFQIERSRAQEIVNAIPVDFVPRSSPSPSPASVQ